MDFPAIDVIIDSLLMQDDKSIPEQTTHVTAVNSFNWRRTAIAIVVIALITGTGGYLLGLRTNQNTSQNIQKVSFQPSPSPTTIPSPTPKKEAAHWGWAGYKNTKYNYSFRYPANWTIFIDTVQKKCGYEDQTFEQMLQCEVVIPPTATSEKVFLTDRKHMLFCCEAAVTSISVINGSIDTKNWRQYAGIPDYRFQSQVETIFAGHNALEVRASTGVDSAGARLILIPGDQFSFVIIQGDHGEPWESITNSFSFE